MFYSHFLLGLDKKTKLITTSSDFIINSLLVSSQNEVKVSF